MAKNAVDTAVEYAARKAVEHAPFMLAEKAAEQLGVSTQVLTMWWKREIVRGFKRSGDRVLMIAHADVEDRLRIREEQRSIKDAEPTPQFHPIDPDGTQMIDIPTALDMLGLPQEKSFALLHGVQRGGVPGIHWGQHALVERAWVVQQVAQRERAAQDAEAAKGLQVDWGADGYVTLDKACEVLHLKEHEVRAQIEDIEGSVVRALGDRSAGVLAAGLPNDTRWPGTKRGIRGILVPKKWVRFQHKRMKEAGEHQATRLPSATVTGDSGKLTTRPADTLASALKNRPGAV